MKKKSISAAITQWNQKTKFNLHMEQVFYWVFTWRLGLGLLVETKMSCTKNLVWVLLFQEQQVLLPPLRLDQFSSTRPPTYIDNYNLSMKPRNSQTSPPGVSDQLYCQVLPPADHNNTNPHGIWLIGLLCHGSDIVIWYKLAHAGVNTFRHRSELQQTISKLSK